jgi:hypothetical protein
MRKVIYLTFGVLLAVTFCLADTYSENPDADTWVWPGYGPYGSSTELRTNIYPTYDQEIVMHFDLSSIPEFSIINSAMLYAYRYTGNGAISGELYRVTEDWDEATLVNAIAHDSANPYCTDVPMGDPTGWKEFDITDLVQDWVDGTYDNYGLVYYGLTGTGYYQRHYSREYADPAFTPYLEVDYEEAAPPPGEFALLTPEDGAVIDVFDGGRSENDFTAITAGPSKSGSFTLHSRTEEPVDVPVLFDWEESEGAETYDLTVDDNDDFSSPEVELTDLTTDFYTYTFTVTESITYYWTVMAHNEVGDTACDEDFSFEFDYNNTNVAPASLGTIKATFQ